MESEKAKLLIVDDELGIVNTLKDFLSLKGYTVIGASSGEEALSILEKDKPDLVLLDIKMPGLKGTEVAKIIKESYPSMKVAILTGYPDEADKLLKDDFLEGVFIKPVRLRELYDKLSEILGPKESSTLSLKGKEGIKARVLMIKAKLLFLERSLEVYSFLSGYFRALSKRGKNYELEAVFIEGEIKQKLTLFEPDLLVINTSFFKEYNKETLAKILEKNLYPKEILIYNIKDVRSLQDKDNRELEKLDKAIETSCLKNGLIEIKWVEI